MNEILVFTVLLIGLAIYGAWRVGVGTSRPISRESGSGKDGGG